MSLLRRYAPKFALNTFRNMRDSNQIASLPPRPFPADNLRSATALDLSALFTSTDWQKSWAADHAAICALFGGEDKMGGVNPGDRRALCWDGGVVDFSLAFASA